VSAALDSHGRRDAREALRAPRTSTSRSKLVLLYAHRRGCGQGSQRVGMDVDRTLQFERCGAAREDGQAAVARHPGARKAHSFARGGSARLGLRPLPRFPRSTAPKGDPPPLPPPPPPPPPPHPTGEESKRATCAMRSGSDVICSKAGHDRRGAPPAPVTDARSISPRPGAYTPPWLPPASRPDRDAALLPVDTRCTSATSNRSSAEPLPPGSDDRLEIGTSDPDTSGVESISDHLESPRFLRADTGSNPRRAWKSLLYN